MRYLLNSYFGHGLPSETGLAEGEISTDAEAAKALFKLCPAAHVTPLTDHADLAKSLNIGRLYLKDERSRMGLGSFKSLGAAYAIAKSADKCVRDGKTDSHDAALQGVTYVCASAGNHGLSMAAGAALFGARAVVYLSDTVPEAFADRLRAKGAEVVRAGHNYEASMAAAVDAAAANGWNLLSDSTWPGYSDPARDVMEGYLIMGMEVVDQMPETPTHIFLQAGVGGLAAASAAAARTSWGPDPVICIVEPDAAPALLGSIAAGKAVASGGPVSNMGRLDCKEPSHLALKYLAREANAFMVVSDAEALAAVATLKENGVASTPSGVAGFAGLQIAATEKIDIGLDENSRVLIYISEGPEDEGSDDVGD
ncbi:MAG: pyridoxal-phosphate dependent enzyme [Alphaproteobacteria bacterium]|jgi:diaminopropionate ammonia-lyase|nr:pyridoxal-phosphate dependent enzyme [Alphaproteobacteria bacterium]MBT4085880.1 pyridoxal-phosphate dependent enzyme [Alphaproteobacteria bacterium]MBT4542647.1 pyridoxal-phosphate dependent enzyme [Alphaproteobacteria bacterium]MBT6384857.1 pyridoxal-phosphate dependent enzyme [Alphaproteobacteria bacterium]MBT7746949.1 pyridoxal-phosphate dependent enzyme [Alphaproteobacteria bacterium]